MPVWRHPSVLTLSNDWVSDNCVLTADGVLDATTYLPLRDAIIKAALDQPLAVVVDVTALSVPAPSAWAVFTSARWHVSEWPGVPVALVCRHIDGRDTIRRSGITRYVPVFASVESAVGDLPWAGKHRYRQRARAELPAVPASLRRSRELVREWLTGWSKTDFVAVASVIATVLVENALAHTGAGLSVRLEADDDTVTVAVRDTGTALASRREPADRTEGIPGLDIVAAVCQAWGNAPDPTGKTVWAVIGPKNRLP